MRHSCTSLPFRIVGSGWPMALAALLAVGVTRAVSAIGGMAWQAGQGADRFLNEPLVTEIYTADPSAHVFNGRIFIYPSHDIDAGVKPDDLGSHFAMRDYHVLSMDASGTRSPTTASPWTSRTCPGRAVRCGRRTPQRRAAGTTCISR